MRSRPTRRALLFEPPRRAVYSEVALVTRVLEEGPGGFSTSASVLVTDGPSGGVVDREPKG